MKLFKKSDTCPGICTPRELYNNYKPTWERKAPEPNFQEIMCFTSPINYTDRDGFHWCLFCSRIYHRTFTQELVECPSCSKLFKGPKLRLSINYECEECE